MLSHKAQMDFLGGRYRRRRLLGSWLKKAENFLEKLPVCGLQA